MKLYLWLFLSVFTSYISIVVFRFAKNRYIRSRLSKFANKNYVIGAAIINMERAMVFEDLESFKFFARYAIRTCLGLEISYPPNEPKSDRIHDRLLEKNINCELIGQALHIYDNEGLNEENIQWEKMLADTRHLVQKLSNLYNENCELQGADLA